MILSGNPTAIRFFQTIYTTHKFKKQYPEVFGHKHSLTVVHGIRFSFNRFIPKQRLKELHRSMTRNASALIVIINHADDLRHIRNELVYLIEILPNELPIIFIHIAEGNLFNYKEFVEYSIITMGPKSDGSPEENIADVIVRIVQRSWDAQESRDTREGWDVRQGTDVRKGPIKKIIKQIDDILNSFNTPAELDESGSEGGMRGEKQEKRDWENKEAEEDDKEIVYYDSNGEGILITPEYLTGAIVHGYRLEGEISEVFRLTIDSKGELSLNFVCDFSYHEHKDRYGIEWSRNYHHYEITSPGFSIEICEYGARFYEKRIQKTILWFSIDHIYDYNFFNFGPEEIWIDADEIREFFEKEWSEVKSAFLSVSQKFKEISERYLRIIEDEFDKGVMLQLEAVEKDIAKKKEEIIALRFKEEDIVEEFMQKVIKKIEEEEKKNIE